MGASHLSFCSAPLHLDHQPEERRLIYWSITEEKRKEKIILKTPFLQSVIPRRKTCFLGGIRLVSACGESSDLVLTPSRSDLVVQCSRFFSGILVVRSTIWALFQGPFF